MHLKRSRLKKHNYTSYRAWHNTELSSEKWNPVNAFELIVIFCSFLLEKFYFQRKILPCIGGQVKLNTASSSLKGRYRCPLDNILFRE